MLNRQWYTTTILFAYFLKKLSGIKTEERQTHTSNNITSINFHFLHCIV